MHASRRVEISPHPPLEPMLITSHLILKILAALVWYTGVVVLLTKSGGLFFEAGKGGAPAGWVILAVVSGLVIGWLKANHMFVHICNRNLERIYALENPMLWQFYRGRFFFFLGLMVSLSGYLYRLVQGDSRLLLVLAGVELSVAIALLVSSRCYWGK